MLVRLIYCHLKVDLAVQHVSRSCGKYSVVLGFAAALMRDSENMMIQI
jgi:hypothetical protein